ncbi:MAG: hypothetical protein H0W15_08865 [Gemmatimonadales bacterium]|nr:hypothetical protein [Gemmatimonadales bacterium]
MTDDASPHSRRAPWHLWLVGTTGLLWNSMGAYDYLMVQTANGSTAGQFTPEQLELFSRFAAWLVAAWALAVWGGVAGAVLLLLRRKLAVPVLLVSLLAMTATAIDNFASASGLYATGGTGTRFVAVIFIVALQLWIYAREMSARGVLR